MHCNQKNEDLIWLNKQTDKLSYFFCNDQYDFLGERVRERKTFG